MAVSLGGSGRSNGNGRRGRYRPLAEINVTPLVDVMLVLLIIFMVTAPLMSTAVNVDLPKVATQPIAQDNNPLYVSIDATGQIYVQDEKVDLPDLVAKLQAISKGDNERRIFVRGDAANKYERVIQVMGAIVQGGFTKAALLSEPPNGLPAPAPDGTAPAPAPANGAQPTVPAPAPAPAPTTKGN